MDFARNLYYFDYVHKSILKFKNRSKPNELWQYFFTLLKLTIATFICKCCNKQKL